MQEVRIAIDYARATALDTVKVRFTGNLDKFEVEDLAITTDFDYDENEEFVIGSVEVGLDDSKPL